MWAVPNKVFFFLAHWCWLPRDFFRVFLQSLIIIIIIIIIYITINIIIIIIIIMPLHTRVVKSVDSISAKIPCVIIILL